MGFLFKHTFKSIRNSPWQTVIILFTVFLAAVLFSFSAEVSAFSSEDYSLNVSASYGNADICISSDGSESSYITSSDVDALCEEGDSYSGYFYVSAYGTGWSALGAAADFETIGDIFDFSFMSEVNITRADMNSGIFVTRDFASKMGLKEGSSIKLNIMGVEKTFKVLGINRTYFFGSYEFLISAQSAVNLLSSVSPLFTVFDASYLPYNRAFVKLADGSDVDAFLTAANRALSGTGWRATMPSSESSSDYMQFLIDVLVVIAMLLAITVAVVVIFFSLNILSEKRHKETEVFLQSGMPPRYLNWSVVIEIFAYIVIGTLLGLLVSYFLIPAVLEPNLWYVYPSLTWRGMLFTILCELAVGIVSLIVYFCRGARHGQMRKASLILSAVFAAIIIALAVAMVFTSVSSRYIFAVLLFFAVIALIFALSGPLCRAFGRLSPKISRRTSGATCLCCSLSGCGNVLSLHNVLRVVAVMVSVIIVIGSLYSFEANRVKGEFQVVDADYYVLNASDAVSEQICEMEGTEATMFALVNATASNGEVVHLTSCEDDSFFLQDVGEISGNDLYIPQAVADLYGYKTGDEVVLSVGGEDISFVLRGYSDSLSYGYFCAPGVGISYDMAAVRTESPGDDFLVSLTETVSVYGAVVQTFEGLFSSTIKNAESFCSILIFYLALIGAIALVGTVNIAVVSYMRRRGEFRLMRTVGMSRGQVARVIIYELLIILVLAAAISALCGWGFVRLMDIGMRSFGYSL